jgi:formate/nitrite transporter
MAPPATGDGAAPPGIDPYAPAEMAARAAATGVTRARLDALRLFALAVLAGAFIALGAQLATLAGVDAGLGYGPGRLLVGVAFSLGLVLVVIAGAELFTGNTLFVIAWLGGQLTAGALLRAWTIAYAGNLVGALATVALVHASGQWALADARVGAGALATAAAKVALGPVEAVARGILGNALVCLAVWLCFSARSNVDKVLSIVGPVTAFVAAGFEHSIANMYFVPMGLLLRGEPAVLAAAALGEEALARLTWGHFVAANLVPVTLGNVIGGGVLVAAAYWTIYLRPGRADGDARSRSE